MSFENYSNAAWQQLRGGPEPDTTPYEESFYGKTQYEGIDFNALTRFIKNQKTDGAIFSRKPFEKGFHSEEAYILMERGGLMSTTYIPNNIPYKYQNDLGETVTTTINGLLNKRTDYLDSSWSFRIQINPLKQQITATLQIYYIDTKKFRVDATDTVEPNDFRIADKYIAIALSTNNLTDFCYLIRDLYGEEKSSYVQGKIAQYFANTLKQTTEPSLLNYLYGHIPDFAYTLIPQHLDYSTMTTHLNILQDYDDKGFFSWFKDSSGAVISLFRLMCNGNSLQLFNTLKNSPELVKRIYYNLDGNSTINNQTEATYVLFANLLYAICLVNGFEGLKERKKTFYIGKNYELDSNVLSGNDEQKDKIFLKQYRKTYTTRTNYETDEFNIGIGSYDYEVVETEAMDAGSYYDPMELVKLIDMDSKDRTPVLVPAIFIKAISDKEEWKNIKQNIRIGLDILAIIIGVATLGTASPLIFALAVVDIGLSAADILVAMNEDELMKTTDGRQFLENWDKIMLVGGIVTAGPALIQSTFKLGTKLLSKATLIETRNFLRGSLIKMILTTNKVINESYDIIIDFATEFGRSTLTKTLPKLYEEGVLIMRNMEQKVKEYVFVFKNEALFSGDLNELQKQIGKILSLKPAEIAEKLKAFLLDFRKTKSVVNTGAEIGDDLTDLTKKWGTVRMKKLQDEYKKVIEMLQEKGITLIETSNINDVYYQVTKIIDKNRQVVRVEKTLSVHPEMRFLDLQHELDHITQMEKNLKDEFCTSARFDGTIQEASATKVTHLNRLNQGQLDFLEYENRIQEIRRLKSNNVPDEVLNKHLDGIVPYKSLYQKNSKKLSKWVDQYFPGFSQNY